MREFWIDHPSQSMPVSFMRWLKFRLSEILERWARKLEFDALYPNGNDDDIPF